MNLKNSEIQLRVPLMKLSNGQKLLSYHGVNLWNSHKPDMDQAHPWPILSVILNVDYEA